MSSSGHLLVSGILDPKPPERSRVGQTLGEQDPQDLAAAARLQSGKARHSEQRNVKRRELSRDLLRLL